MNWDYIAGFYDGEGSVYRHCRGKKVVYRIEISQLDNGVLDEIATFLIANKIYCKVYKDGHYWKQHCKRLMINGYKDVIKFILKMEGRCIVKKKKLENAYEIMIKYVPTHTWRRDWDKAPHFSSDGK